MQQPVTYDLLDYVHGVVTQQPDMGNLLDHVDAPTRTPTGQPLCGERARGQWANESTQSN